jgi:putative membrane protein
MPRNFYTDLCTPLQNADLLSLERNKLSNERTLLAYSRTFLSFFVAGVSLIQFFNNVLISSFGYVLIPLGFVIMGFGLFRYYRTRKRIKDIRVKFLDEDKDDDIE